MAFFYQKDWFNIGSFTTVFLRMCSGYNSETLLIPATATAISYGAAPEFGGTFETLSNPAATQQYPTALRPGFVGFDSVSELYPEDILRHTVCEYLL